MYEVRLVNSDFMGNVVSMILVSEVNMFSVVYDVCVICGVCG